MKDTHTGWRRKDAWLGLAFLLLGAMVTAYAFLAMRNGMPMLLWGTAWLFGPLLALLGGNAVVRAMRAPR